MIFLHYNIVLNSIFTCVGLTAEKKKTKQKCHLSFVDFKTESKKLFYIMKHRVNKGDGGGVRKGRRERDKGGSWRERRRERVRDR